MVEMKKQEELITLAQDMLERAYVPYSKFKVGAALLSKDGKMYGGCNIENASYGLTNCAERTAFFRAVAEGDKEFSYLVITGNTDGPISPCGACRQVIAEFCDDDMPVLLTNTSNDSVETTVGDLLPGYFKSGDMTNGK